MSEYLDQALLVERCRNYDWHLRQQELPESGVGSIFHIPNGGKRQKSEAARLKVMGVVAGVADLMVPIVKVEYGEGVFGKRVVDQSGRLVCRVIGGLWLEMKRGGVGAAKGRASKAQEEWAVRMIRAGYAHAVAHGTEEGWRVICDYAGIKEL